MSNTSSSTSCTLTTPRVTTPRSRKQIFEYRVFHSDDENATTKDESTAESLGTPQTVKRLRIKKVTKIPQTYIDDESSDDSDSAQTPKSGIRKNRKSMSALIGNVKQKSTPTLTKDASKSTSALCVVDHAVGLGIKKAQPLADADVLGIPLQKSRSGRFIKIPDKLTGNGDDSKNIVSKDLSNFRVTKKNPKPSPSSRTGSPNKRQLRNLDQKDYNLDESSDEDSSELSSSSSELSEDSDGWEGFIVSKLPLAQSPQEKSNSKKNSSSRTTNSVKELHHQRSAHSLDKVLGDTDSSSGKLKEWKRNDKKSHSSNDSESLVTSSPQKRSAKQMEKEDSQTHKSNGINKINSPTIGETIPVRKIEKNIKSVVKESPLKSAVRQEDSYSSPDDDDCSLKRIINSAGDSTPLKKSARQSNKNYTHSVISSDNNKSKLEKTVQASNSRASLKRSATKPIKKDMSIDDEENGDKDEDDDSSVKSMVRSSGNSTPVKKPARKRNKNYKSVGDSSENEPKSKLKKSRASLKRSATKPIKKDMSSDDEENDVSSPDDDSSVKSMVRSSGNSTPVKKSARQKNKNYKSVGDSSDTEPKSKLKKSRASLKRSATKPVKNDVSSDDELPRTPLQSKRKHSVVEKTPRSSSIRVNLLTPSMPIRDDSVATPSTPLEEARARLHVSAVPKVLLCREVIFRKIELFLEGRILDKCGGSMYISGVPGTGKTATVRHVISSLRARVANGDLEKFEYVEVNGMRMTTPHQVYVQILHALTGEKASWEQAMKTLEKLFTRKSKKTTIVLVDELDLICNKRQDIIYNLLDWPRKPDSRLVVLTIANTMDLPEKLLSAKVTSRMGLNRSIFKPYSSSELEEIVTSRLSGIEAFEVDAVRLVAKKVASISGDCRRALDICRRATEVAENEAGKIETPKKHKSKAAPMVMVNMAHVQSVLEEMMASFKIKAIKGLSRMEQLFLRSVATAVELGTDQTEFQKVYPNMQAFCTLEGLKVPTVTDLLNICSKLSTLRMIICQHSKHDVRQKILLNCDADDIHWALTNINN